MLKISSFVLTSIATSVIVSFPAVSQQRAGFDLNAQLTATYIYQDNDRENGNFSGLDTLQVVPQLNALYTSSKFSGLLSGSINHFERDNDSFSQEDTFTQFSYNANLEIVENLLSLRAAGTQAYQNNLAGNFLVNDFVNDQGQLIKTRTNQFSAIVTVRNGDYIRGSGQLSYSIVESEQNEFANNVALDNDIVSGQMEITQGDHIRNMTWRIQSSFQQSERPELQSETINQSGDFTNRNTIADIDISFANSWALRLTGQHEANQLANSPNQGNIGREFNTYGLGLTYRVAPNRSISVTYNETNSDLETDDNDSFVGLDLLWEFTPRTGIQARYTKRFFGESGNVNLNYNTRRLRTALTYTEDVTTNALLIANPQNLGVFVCPLGETAIGQCFQPNSLDYTPQPGEQLVQFNSQNLEINNNPILRKALNAQIGYSFSRLTLSIFSNYAEETFINSETIRRTISGGSTFSYSLGQKTNLNANIRYAEIIARGENDADVILFQTGENNNWNVTTGISRQFGQNLTVNTSFTYLEQDGTIEGPFGAGFKDRRFSISLAYRYQ